MPTSVASAILATAKITFAFLALLALSACKERPIQDEIFYFVLPDRFANGDVRNDTGGVDGDRSVNGLDATDAAYYHGGDLKGLGQKLDYLKDMGITAIWLTPIFKNEAAIANGAGYHGYWTLDYTQVDPHLGSNKDLADLIKKAHKKDMKVFFDIVVNHTADVIAYEECHNPDGSLLDGLDRCAYAGSENPPYTPFIPSGRDNDKVPAWLNDTARYNNRGDSTFEGESSVLGDFFGLDDLNTADPVVVEGMIDIFKFWISEFKIDGFRLDTVKHVDMSFWQQWSPAIKAHAEAQGIDNFFIFGEVFDGSPRVVSRYTTEGTLPGALDFGLYFASKDVFANNAGPARLAGIFQEDDWYRDNDSDASMLLNFVSNHDVGRLGRDIQQANPSESDAQHLARLQLAYALNYFARGVPVVYYGDEQGFTGDGGDKGSREDMMPSAVASYNDNDLIGTSRTTTDNNFQTSHPLYRTLRDYAKVLQQHDTLRYGRMIVRHADSEPGVFAFSRIWEQDGREYLVVMNTASEEKTLTLPATTDRYSIIHGKGKALKTQANDTVDVVVQPLSVVIYRGRQDVTTPELLAVELELDDSRKVSGRFEIPATVSWQGGTAVPTTRVVFAVSVDGGEFVETGMDDNPDYRLFYNADQHPAGTELTFRATAKNFSGNGVESSLKTVVVGAEPGMKLTFKKPDSWGANINLYYWNADPAPGVSWPGIATTALGNGWYEYQFEDGVQMANLIFNDGQGNQTGDLYREADGCYISQTWQDSCDPDTDGGGGPVDPDAAMAVYFQQPAGWTDVNIYYWNTNVPAPGVSWPGIAMTALGDEWYTFQFPAGVTASNIIFNNGTGAQTSDLFREGSGCYDLAGNTWSDDCDYPRPGLLVRFKKPDAWGASINIYYWNAGDQPAVNWPGVAAVALGDGWYEFQFPAGVGSANLIFNDGQGNQTADLFRDADGCFGESGSDWTATCTVPDNTVISISEFRAHWLEQGNLAWQVVDSRATKFKLLGSATAGISITDNQIQGADSVFELNAGGSLSQQTRTKFPHLSVWPVYQSAITTSEAQALLKGQLVVAAYDSGDKLLEATRVQTAGVIDALYEVNAELGVTVSGSQVALNLWAPTARSVKLKRYDGAFNLLGVESADSVNQGVYTFSGDSGWLEQYYRYEVTVYHPASDAMETFEVTDPYAVSLSTDSKYSQMVDIANDYSLKPVGWDALVKDLPEHRDITVYEGHIRDFSASDMTVPEDLRGKYLAFIYNGTAGEPLSNGMAHLQSLREAGLSHFHVLPVNDLASVQEDPAKRVDLDDPYSRLCDRVTVASVQAGCAEFGDTPIREVFAQLAASDPVNNRIQAINYDDRLNGMPGVDGFNWGYDPYHFNVPEGSYATDTNGKARIREFRDMVMALDAIGLKLVVDVVFNHTYASGLSDQAVLDKVVPGYYHRRNAFSGAVESSTCCDNTAAEHEMMAHLMVQSLKNWAVNYKVDGFRFDLMGHHPKAVMQQIQAELATLTPTNDGVQGNRIYLYGEGWDFGEVAGGQRFEQATQLNMAGTGIGTFNDRLRDAVRGGNFTDRGRAQGFANGNELYPNGVTGGAAALGDQGDRIRIGLAGNLQTYVFEDNGGNLTNGLSYSGVGYNLDPQENILYIDKHDNETLWDNTQAKLPDSLSMDERVRVHLLSQAFVNFGQGVPFHQMGTDLLRSKSMDRDSFDAGDWFNRVDFSKQGNNWAVGLPSEDKNAPRWTVMAQLMSNPEIDPQPAHIQLAAALFQEQLKVRYSSPLFRLDTAQEVAQRVGFLNTGATQIDGLIVMTLSDGACTMEDKDGQRDGLVVLFNADDDALSYSNSALAGLNLSLHPVLAEGSDPLVKTASYSSASGTFGIPGRTAAVFVAAQDGQPGDFPCNDKAGIVTTPGITVYFEDTQGWGNVSAYYWSTEPGSPAVNWPGVPMNNLGGNWYSFTFPNGVTAANLIFNNNGGGQQTADLYRAGDGCFEPGSAAWSDTCTLPGLAFWFRKPAEWSDAVNFYFWGAAAESPGWPGIPMDNAGDGWFFVQMPEGVRSTNLIFNDAGPSGSGAQTSDLFRNQSGCYSIASGWTAGCEHP